MFARNFPSILSNLRLCSHRAAAVLAASICLLAATSTVLAQIPATADSYISSSSPTTNYGSMPVLAIAPDTSSFIQFNLASLPAGATIQKATLVLFVDSFITAGKFGVYVLESSAYMSWMVRGRSRVLPTTTGLRTPTPRLGRV